MFHKNKRKFFLPISVFIYLLVNGCSQSSSLKTPTPTITPETPSKSPTTIVFTSTPEICSSTQWQGEIQVLSNGLFTALGLGGPTVFDRILVEQNPDWANFRQTDHNELRSAGVIFHETAFGPELGTGVNPAVLLITYGINWNWELPANNDLVVEVDHIRSILFQHRSEWVQGNVDQSQYPVANAATYALYRYFDGDLSKLEDWCHSYVQIYEESPVK